MRNGFSQAGFELSCCPGKLIINNINQNAFYWYLITLPGFIFRVNKTSLLTGTFADLDEYLNSLVGFFEGEYICNVCHKKFKQDKRNARVHIEAKHLQNYQVSCNLCGFVSKSRDSLRKHVKSYHNS